MSALETAWREVLIGCPIVSVYTQTHPSPQIYETYGDIFLILCIIEYITTYKIQKDIEIK